MTLRGLWLATNPYCDDAARLGPTNSPVMGRRLSARHRRGSFMRRHRLDDSAPLGVTEAAAMAVSAIRRAWRWACTSGCCAEGRENGSK
jgi:hypothetical protein